LDEEGNPVDLLAELS